MELQKSTYINVCNRFSSQCCLFRLLKFEIPRGVLLVDEPWTTDNGMITAAMKLKRKTIKEYYADQIKALFGNLEGSQSLSN